MNAETQKERLPQRFRYRRDPADAWEFGACIPHPDGVWEFVTSDFGNVYFDDDPWEVAGMVLAAPLSVNRDPDAFEFVWIDNDFHWLPLTNNKTEGSDETAGA